MDEEGRNLGRKEGLCGEGCLNKRGGSGSESRLIAHGCSAIIPTCRKLRGSVVQVALPLRSAVWSLSVARQS